jgi:SAM-dependent methyltransferase
MLENRNGEQAVLLSVGHRPRNAFSAQWMIERTLSGGTAMAAAADFAARVDRSNLLETTAESWRPPALHRPAGAKARITAFIRRLVDLQAGSIQFDLQRILPHLEGILVDVGCGAQPYRDLAGERVKYVALDTADANAHFGYGQGDILVIQDGRWPVLDHDADAVLASEVLEHVEETAAFLAEAARCLRPGGLLILTVPFAARWHYIPWDYWRFTPSGLARLLQNAGFTDLRVYARGNELTVFCYKALALIWPLLLPQCAGRLARRLRQVIGILLSPLAGLLSLLGTASYRLSQGGNDCLGYTVLATRETLSPSQ